MSMLNGGILCLVAAAVCWIAGWIAVAILYWRLRDKVAQYPELLAEAELVTRRRVLEVELEELTARVNASRTAAAAAGAAEAGAVAQQTRLNEDIRELRQEKKELVERVRRIKEEAHSSQHAGEQAELTALQAEARRQRAEREAEILERDCQRLSGELARLRAEGINEEQHAGELRRRREQDEQHATSRIEAVRAELTRLETAVSQQQLLLAELTRAVAKEESRLDRYRR